MYDGSAEYKPADVIISTRQALRTSIDSHIAPEGALSDGMAALVIGALILLLVVALCRMALDRSPDARMTFLADLLAAIPEAMPDRVKHEHAFFGRPHHRHRFGV